MPIFPLDAVRNAAVDRALEPYLEDVREDIVRFPFWSQTGLGDVEEVLEAYDMARPRLNVLASQLRPMEGRFGADIGTGLGFLPVLLHRLGITVVAAERDPRIACFAAAHGIEVREYDIGRSQLPFLRGSLDFLVLAEVLEHLKQAPVAVLREVTSLLRPGAPLLVTTPNVARLAHIEALGAGENFLERFPEDLPPGTDVTDHIEHVREYSVREVVDAMEAVGLAVEEVVMTGWGESGYDLLANPYVNEIIVAAGRK